MNETRFIVLAGMMLTAVVSRWIPHPPNFSPVAALTLFGGASFAGKRAVLLVPLAGLFASDFVLGFYSITPVVYASFALIVCLGFWLRHCQTFPRFVFATVAGAVLFFVLTNFGVWAMDNLYPKTWVGLAGRFVAAIPFFWNTLLSDLFYSAVLFGGLALAEERWPVLVETASAAA